METSDLGRWHYLVKVLIGDYNAHLGRSIENYLNKVPGVIFSGYVDHPHKLNNQIEELQPDVVVLDFMHPMAKGIQTVETIINNFRNVKVMVISSIDDDDFVGVLANLGVSFYLMKPFTLSCLAKRISYVGKLDKSSPSFLQYAYNREALEKLLIEYLNRIGIYSNLKGHRYLIDGIIMIGLNKPWLNRGITVKLYPEIARYHNTTPSKVERAIRYAIDMAWSKGNLEALNQLFPHAIDAEKGKPSNAAFIAKMADIINYNLLAQ